MTATRSIRQVVVVDAQLEDYRALVERAREPALRLTTTSTVVDALRLAPSFPDALWLVSTALPDGDGFELLQMLRSLQPRLSVCIVDNRADAHHEQRAVQLAASLYLVKPVRWEWFAAWRGPLSTVHPPLQPSTASR